MALKSELLEILVCPKCRQPVVLSEDGQWLDCFSCGLRYEVRDDIPIMLVEEAKPLES